MKTNSLKTVLWIIAAILLLVVVINGVVSGLMQRHDVVLDNYAVSADGTEIALKVSVLSSAGYVRGYKDNGGGVKPHYLTFYSTFGGINSRLGANDTFTLSLGKDDTMIYFSRPNGGYKPILKKNQDGKWERVKP